jgi:hypothetical protein
VVLSMVVVVATSIYLRGSRTLPLYSYHTYTRIALSETSGA